MKVLKKRLVPFMGIVVSFLIPACSQRPSPSPQESGIYPISGWSTAPGDSSDRAKDDFDDSSWTRLEPFSGLAVTDPESWFWLRMDFSVPKELAHDGVLLSMGRFPFPAQIHLNGTLIAEWGSLPPAYSAQQGIPLILELPPGVLRRDSPNTLALRCNFLGSATGIPYPDLRSRARFATWRFFSDLLNARLFYVFSAAFLFMTLILFLLAAVEKKGFPYFLFALSCATMAMYYSEIGAPRAIVSSWYMRVMMKTCLNVSLGFLIHFFSAYFGNGKNPAMTGWTYILMFLSSVLILRSGNEVALQDAIMTSLWITLALTAYCMCLLVRAVVADMRGNGIMIAGAFLGLTMGGYDAYYTFTYANPFALLQGIGLFMLYLSVFIVISRRLSGGLRSREHGNQGP